MKTMKKFASLLLALVMVLSLTTTAFAGMEGNITGGSITIKNPAAEQTYNAYQILYLESYNAETGAYAYKANSAWAEWLKTQTAYIAIDAQGYVTWVDGADVAAFAKAAQTQMTDKQIDGTATADAAGTEITISGLMLGYYLVDTTLGSLCSLDTTNPSVDITEKNTAPTIEKQVQEDSTGEWGDSNTAQVGDTVNFKITVNAYAGAQSYIVHDKMTAGLTFNADSVAVDGAVAGTDYTVETENLDDGDTFHIVFTQTYLDKITANTTITITYSAILNDAAVISTGSNNNETKLSYGDNSATDTEWDKTQTFTFQFDLVKTDGQNEILDGAKFEMYDAVTDGNKIDLVKTGESTYRVATDAEKAAEGFVSAVIETVNGKAVVSGLDANTTYWLEETEAPDGYNKLAERVKVEIADANLSATVDAGVWTAGGVHVVNQTGSELPATGGIGTTIFYGAGIVLVLVAVVLLVTKKRMGAAK